MKTKSSKSGNQVTPFGTTKTFLIALLLIFAAQFTVAQTVHTVDNRSESGAMYTSVNAAITAAVVGDTIYIHPSPTSYGSVTVNKTLTLIGLGHNPANTNGLRAVLSAITFSNSCFNSVIKGLETHNIAVTGQVPTNADGVKIINNKITGSIQNSGGANLSVDWVIEGNYFTSTSFAIYPSEANWFISNNWMRGGFSRLGNTSVIINNIIVSSAASGNPIIFDRCNSPIVANNIFLFTQAATGVGLSSSTINFQNCMTYNYTGIVLDPLGDGTGGNFDETNPLFTNVPANTVTDFYNNDYSLTAGSPGAGAGTDGTDLGIYGRLFDFDPNGRPDLMPYPTLINITNTVIAPGQSLNVDFSASIKQ
ncbi:MAG: hypothetical protein L3J25_10670 [Flavobacteriaceae bacterium]|nr:hypothetical protein [Flavobacteriaceae bacterium]